METRPQRILITVSGRDKSGITASLTGVIADNHAVLVDIEQVVVQGQLTLCLLVEVAGGRGEGEPLLKDLLFAAKQLGLELQFRLLDGGTFSELPPPDLKRYAITAIGEGLGVHGVHKLTTVLAEREANLEHIRRLSSGTLSSLEVICSVPTDTDGARGLRRALLEAMADEDVDIAVQRERLTRRSKRLCVMDMDSTLIQIEVIDEIARMHGVVDQVSAITARAMAGELDFEQSLRERVGLLKGLEVEKVSSLARNLPLTEGAADLLAVLRKLGFKTGVISGGFTFAANALKARLGIDYAYANELEIADGKLTGRVLDPIVTPQRKADLLDAIAQREQIDLEQTIAIGDGANDLTMLERAGLGIAFHAKPKVKESADTSVSAGGLDRILFLLGLHAREVEELMASVHETL